MITFTSWSFPQVFIFHLLVGFGKDYVLGTNLSIQLRDLKVFPNPLTTIELMDMMFGHMDPEEKPLA